MQTIAKVMNALFRFYQVLAFLAGGVLFLAFFFAMLVVFGSEPFLSTSDLGRFATTAGLSLVEMYFMAAAFKGLRDFMLAKQANASIAEQQTSLRPVIKSLCAVFAVGALALVLKPDMAISQETADFAASLPMLSLDFLIPNFSGATALMFALVLHLYVKNLDEQHLLSVEAAALKQEVELTI